MKISFFDLVREEVRLPNGNISKHLTLEHPGAVVILPELAPDLFVMIRQYRHSVGRTLLEFPAGTLGKDEEPLACAQREICEEISFEASEWRELGLLVPAPGFCNEEQHLFYARGLSPRSAPADEDEIIEVVQLRSGEIEEAMRSGDLIDAKSIAIYARARCMGLITTG